MKIKIKNKLLIFVISLFFQIHSLNGVKLQIHLQEPLAYSFTSDESTIKIINTFITFNDKIRIKGDYKFDNKGMVINFKEDNEDVDKLKKEYEWRSNEEDEYWIDYRLVIDCEIKFSLLNNYFSFTLRKLEDNLKILTNRGTEKDETNPITNNNNNIISVLNVKIDFEENNKSNISELTNKLTTNCKARKDKINNLKKEILNYSDKKTKFNFKLTNLQKEIKEKQAHKENIQNFISDSDDFIQQKKSLINLSLNQIKYLKELQKKSIIIKQKEITEQNYIMKRLEIVNGEIFNKEKFLLFQTQSVADQEKIFTSLKEEVNNYAKDEINLRKSYLEIEEKVNKIKSEKNNIQVDLQQDQEILKSEKDEKIKLNNEIKTIENKIKLLNKTINDSKSKKLENEKLNNLEKQEMKGIDDKITNLLVLRNKKVQQIKLNYDNIKETDDVISSSESELYQLNYKSKLIKIKISENYKKLNEIANNNKLIENQKKVIYEKYENLSNDLKKLNFSISEINNKKSLKEKSLISFKEKFNVSTDKLSNITTDKDDLERNKRILELDIKRIISDINNNDIQIKNFDHEKRLKEKVDLGIGKDNIDSDPESFNLPSKLNEEYIEEKENLDKEIKNIKNQYDELKIKEKSNIKEYSKFIEEELRRELPQSKVLIDLINEEMSNFFNFKIDNLKKLLDHIKNS